MRRVGTSDDRRAFDRIQIIIPIIAAASGVTIFSAPVRHHRWCRHCWCGTISATHQWCGAVISDSQASAVIIRGSVDAAAPPLVTEVSLDLQYSGGVQSLVTGRQRGAWVADTASVITSTS